MINKLLGRDTRRHFKSRGDRDATQTEINFAKVIILEVLPAGTFNIFLYGTVFIKKRKENNFPNTIGIAPRQVTPGMVSLPWDHKYILYA